MLKSIDDVLDTNRKLLNVLGKRLQAPDSDEVLGQEFFYVSKQADVDQLITTELDSAFVVGSMMLPRRGRVPADEYTPTETNTAPQMVIENLSAARQFVQGGDDSRPSQLRAGLSPLYFAMQRDNTASPTVYSGCFQYFFKEPFLIAPGSVLRASYLTAVASTAPTVGAYTRVGAAYYDTWILLGYKIKLQ